MSDLLVLCAFLSFAVFLIVRVEKYAALAGWACIVLNLWSELPSFFKEDNFLYPVLSLLSIPFLAITADRLLRSDPVVLQLSRTAAISTIIFVPFALVPLLRDALISLVVTLAFGLITALGHSPHLVAWDIIAEKAFYNQIIPGCTGIIAIALMLGVAFGEKNLTGRQGVLAFLLVVPSIVILNLLRVSVVFIAVSDTWFSSFPDPTGTGDANFFWAHNVIAEGLAGLFLLVLVWGLVRIIPDLGVFARRLVGVYRESLRELMNAVRNAIWR
jgi:archaeosortase A (PGF-CTERM-specific)